MSTIDSLKTAGNEAFAKGEVKAAIKHFSEAIVLMEKEKRADAKSKGETSLKIYEHPAAAALYSNRSMCYLKEDMSVEAKHDADLCIAAKPDWWKGHCRRAYALEGLGQYKEAMESLIAATKLEGGDNAEINTKIKNIGAVIAKQEREAAKPATATTAAKKKKGAATSVPNPAIIGDWRATAMKQSEVPPPTLNSRKGQKLAIRPTILDFAPAKVGAPFFFPAAPTWPNEVEKYADDFVETMVGNMGSFGPTGGPRKEMRFLLNMAANAYCNQKSADDQYRAQNKIKPACDFCGISLEALPSPPSCECGEPYCSRECMALHWKDHKQICDTIRSQSESLSTFHGMYWEGCGYGQYSWIGARVPNYTAIYLDLKRQQKVNNTPINEGSMRPEKKLEELISLYASPTVDYKDIGDWDEFTYLMLHERSAVVKMFTDLQIVLQKAMLSGNTKLERDASVDQCAALLEMYLRYSYFDAKRDTVHRVQFKMVMLQMLHDVLSEFQMQRHVEPLDVAIQRFDAFMCRAATKDIVPEEVIEAQLKLKPRNDQ